MRQRRRGARPLLPLEDDEGLPGLLGHGALRVLADDDLHGLDALRVTTPGHVGAAEDEQQARLVRRQVNHHHCGILRPVMLLLTLSMLSELDQIH